MDDQSTQIFELLKQPIAVDCYMISKDWWEQWVAFSKSGERNRSEPGLICNIDLV